MQDCADQHTPRCLPSAYKGRSIIEFCKKINIKDVVYMAAAAWDDVPALTLAKSWHKLIQINDCTTASSSTDHIEDQTSDQSGCEMLLHQLDSNLQDEDISKWINGDADDQGYQLLSDEETIQQVTIQQPNDTPDHHEEDEAEDSKVANSGEVAEDSTVPNSGEVVEMLDKCLLWYEQQEESTYTFFT